MKILLEKLELNVCSSRKEIASPTLTLPESPSSEISLKSPISSTSTASEISGQKVHSKDEQDFSEQLNLLSQCSCLKHISHSLDDVFKLNLEQTHLECSVVIRTWDVSILREVNMKNLVLGVKHFAT